MLRTNPQSLRYSPECVEGEFCEVRLVKFLRTSPERASKKFAQQGNGHLAYKLALLAREKWPCGRCITHLRVSTIVHVRSGAPAPRERQTRREAGAQSPWTSLGER
jgi:hypothetical protein